MVIDITKKRRLDVVQETYLDILDSQLIKIQSFVHYTFNNSLNQVYYGHAVLEMLEDIGNDKEQMKKLAEGFSDIDKEGLEYRIRVLLRLQVNHIVDMLKTYELASETGYKLFLKNINNQAISKGKKIDWKEKDIMNYGVTEYYYNHEDGIGQIKRYLMGEDSEITLVHDTGEDLVTYYKRVIPENINTPYKVFYNGQYAPMLLERAYNESLKDEGYLRNILYRAKHILQMERDHLSEHIGHELRETHEVYRTVKLAFNYFIETYKFRKEIEMKPKLRELLIEKYENESEQCKKLITLEDYMYEMFERGISDKHFWNYYYEHGKINKEKVDGWHYSVTETVKGINEKTKGDLCIEDRIRVLLKTKNTYSDAGLNCNGNTEQDVRRVKRLNKYLEKYNEGKPEKDQIDYEYNEITDIISLRFVNGEVLEVNPYGLYMRTMRDYEKEVIYNRDNKDNTSKSFKEYFHKGYLKYSDPNKQQVVYELILWSFDLRKTREPDYA